MKSTFLFFLMIIYLNSFAQKKYTYCFYEEKDILQDVYKDTFLVQKRIFYPSGTQKGIIYFDKDGFETKVTCYYENGKIKETIRRKVKLLSWTVKTISIQYDKDGKRHKTVKKERVQLPSM